MFLFYVLFKKGDTIQGGKFFKGGHYLRKYGRFSSLASHKMINKQKHLPTFVQKLVLRIILKVSLRNQHFYFESMGLFPTLSKSRVESPRIFSARPPKKKFGFKHIEMLRAD